MIKSDNLKRCLQYLLPQHTLSRVCGKLAGMSAEKLKNLAIKRFISHFNVDMSLAQEPDPCAYPDFNSFFIRHLKPELRPITTGENDIACPVDGIISQIGRIKEDNLLQAKGLDYNVCDLLGGDSKQAELFQDGYFATLYLSPKDYHRVHMPFTGVLQEMIYIPGKLFSVQPITVRTIKKLFTRNERAVCLFSTAIGPMAIILVGAVIVAGIHTRWHGQVTPQPKKKQQHWHYSHDPAIILQGGEEMGYFQLGSTVIVLFSKSSKCQWSSAVYPGATVKYGQLLAQHPPVNAGAAQ